jgi:type IV pilus assembly protein PilE
MVRQHGFTLIELMITLVIAAILATVAVPSYQDHVRKARRADAYHCLLDAAQRQESFFYRNNTYTTKIEDLGLKDLGLNNASCGEHGYYNLEITAADSTGYQLLAKRVAPQDADKKCGDLTLASTGEKGNVGADLPPADCW